MNAVCKVLSLFGITAHNCDQLADFLTAEHTADTTCQLRITLLSLVLV